MTESASVYHGVPGAHLAVIAVVLQSIDRSAAVGRPGAVCLPRGAAFPLAALPGGLRRRRVWHLRQATRGHEPGEGNAPEHVSIHIIAYTVCDDIRGDLETSYHQYQGIRSSACKLEIDIVVIGK